MHVSRSKRHLEALWDVVPGVLWTAFGKDGRYIVKLALLFIFRSQSALRPATQGANALPALFVQGMTLPLPVCPRNNVIYRDRVSFKFNIFKHQ